MTQEQKSSDSIHSIDSCANSQLDESKEHVNIDSNLGIRGQEGR